MAAFFLDSSAVVKLYLSEPGSVWLGSLATPRTNELIIVRITLVEVAAEIFRRNRAGTLPTQTASPALYRFRRDLATLFRVVEVTPRLADEAMSIAEDRALRGYDCVQLAALLTVNRTRGAASLDELLFLTADRELGAAELEGLRVEDPNAR